MGCLIVLDQNARSSQIFRVPAQIFQPAIPAAISGSSPRARNAPIGRIWEKSRPTNAPGWTISGPAIPQTLAFGVVARAPAARLLLVCLMQQGAQSGQDSGVTMGMPWFRGDSRCDCLTFIVCSFGSDRLSIARRPRPSACADGRSIPSALLLAQQRHSKSTTPTPLAASAACRKSNDHVALFASRAQDTRRRRGFAPLLVGRPLWFPELLQQSKPPTPGAA